MKDLNKYNTALDLSKLSKSEVDELTYILTKNNIKSVDNSCIKYFEFSKELNLFNFIDLTPKIIIDYQTFKQIHFTR